MLALGSRLCLVSHRLYLPTSYLVKVRREHRVGGVGGAAMGGQAPATRAPGSCPLLRSCARRRLMRCMTLH